MKHATVAAILYFIVKNYLTVDAEENCCAPRFVDNVRSCPNFGNQIINEAALIMGFQAGDEEVSGLRMSGAFDLLSSIEDDHEIEITVTKLTDLGKEYMYSAVANICESLKDEEAPWAPLVKSVNLTSCPIKEGVYPMSEVILNLEFANDLMKHEFCGEYELEISVLRSLQKVTCFIMPAEIYEKAQK